MARFLDSGEMSLLAWWMDVRYGHRSATEQGNVRTRIIKQLKREPERRADFFSHLSTKRKEFNDTRNRVVAEQEAKDEANRRAEEAKAPHELDKYFRQEGEPVWQ